MCNLSIPCQEEHRGVGVGSPLLTSEGPIPTAAAYSVRFGIGILAARIQRGIEMIETASNVAKYILSQFRAKGTLIINLKLQKLLYYTQAWHLALYDSSVI